MSKLKLGPGVKNTTLDLDPHTLRVSCRSTLAETLEAPLCDVAVILALTDPEPETSLRQEPDDESLPRIVPRFVALTCSEWRYIPRPNLFLVFRNPVKLPKIKRFVWKRDLGRPPKDGFPMSAARDGDIWVDGLALDARHPKETYDELCRNGMSSALSIPEFFRKHYGTAARSSESGFKWLASLRASEHWTTRTPPTR
jgi:hypothetical protein